MQSPTQDYLPVETQEALITGTRHIHLACRYLSEDALQQAGVVAERCIGLACSTMEAYLEETTPQGVLRCTVPLKWCAEASTRCTGSSSTSATFFWFRIRVAA